VVATYLDAILAYHRARAAADTRRDGELEALVAGLPPARAFEAALRERARAEQVAVIAEVKRRSPSAGALAPDLDPAALARAYARGGAACLSVLTDGPHFGGSREDLQRARAAVALPVLRKDFTVAPGDVYDARAMGADAVLLIVAALAEEELRRLLALATSLGLAALVEVHEEGEVAAALRAGAQLIGVNQRDLRSFQVDTARALRLARCLPPDVVAVAESGIRDPSDVERLAAAGYHAVLVGEHLVGAEDPVRELLALRAGRAGTTEVLACS
jgi:indole-3-glycerol phosphate synthase